MKIKNYKGYIGIDVTLSILIIFILAPIIITMTYNISKSNSSIKRKTQALSLATNAIESAKEIYSLKIAENQKPTLSELYDDIESRSKNLYGLENVTRSNSNVVVDIDDVLYKIILQLNNERTNLNVKVYYHVGARDEYIEIATDFIIS